MAAKKTTTKAKTTKPPVRKTAKKTAKKPGRAAVPAPAADWRSTTLERVRQLIHAADPDIVEERKWMGTPVWTRNGNLCTGETYKNVVKLTFAKGAALKDPSRLFNSSLEGNVRRAIDIREADEIDERAFQELVRAAVAQNLASRPPRTGKA